MDTKTFNVSVDLLLVPKFYADPPQIRCGFGNDIIERDLVEPSTISFNTNEVAGNYTVFVEFLNKKNTDTNLELNLDKTVTIKKITLNGLAFDSVVNHTVYYPIYPEPWYSQQDPKPDKYIIGVQELGWNGRWELSFGVPVFTWIHQVENLGWVWTI